MKLPLDINKFMEWLRAKQLSNTTIKQYLSSIYYLDLDNITEQTLLDYLYKHKCNYNKAALLNLFYYVKANKSLYDPELVTLIKGFEFPKITAHKKRRLPNILSIEEVFSIADQMPSKDYKLMVILTFHLGLRRNELLKLKISDFNWDVWFQDRTKYGMVRIIGKGNKQRNLPVPYEIMIALDKMIGEQLQKDNTQERLFNCGRTQWTEHLHQASLKAINRNVNPHLLRHSAASYLREQGLDLKEIQEFLGHESIATTQLYTYVKPVELNKKIIGAFG